MLTAREQDAFLTVLKAVSGTPTSTYLHGAGGLLSTPTTRSTIVNAAVAPLSGLATRLPYRPSNYVRDVVEVYTGQTANTGTQNTTACGDAKQVGNLMTCRYLLSFGRASLETQVLQVDRVGELLNRGDFRDYRLIGDPWNSAVTPQPVDINGVLDSEVDAKIAALWNGWYYEYGTLPYTGNPANTTGNTGYQEYAGLDIQINTGKVDVTSVACPAADSLLWDAGNADILTNGQLYFSQLNAIYSDRKYLAIRLGLPETRWAWTMRRSQFRDLTAVWPCSYLTGSCGAGSATQIGPETVKERDEMRQGMYLKMENGDQVEVIIDDIQPETIPVAGTYRSKMYLLPMTNPKFTDSGGNITFMEFFNFDGPEGFSAISAARRMAPADSFTTIGGGRFLFHKKPPTNECVQVRITGKERLICRAPFLGARIDNTQSTPAYHERSPIPGNALYVNGGVITR